MTSETGEESLADVSVEQWTLKPSPRKAVTEIAECAIRSDFEGDSSSGSSSSSDRRIGSSMAALTPSKPVGGILRVADTPGTGRSVRFGKRLYDDGDESRMSDSVSSANVVLSSADRITSIAQDESTEDVEKSLQSISLPVDEDDRLAEDTMAQLPALAEYSDLLEDEVSLDESVLRSEVNKLQKDMARNNDPLPNTPHSTMADTSLYQSALGGDSAFHTPSTDFVEWNTPHSAMEFVRDLHVEGQDGAETSNISVPWASSVPPESPSAERAGRIDVSVFNQSTLVLLPGTFTSTKGNAPLTDRQDRSLALAPYEPLLDLSHSTSDSSLEELLRATQELDYVHFEQSEALRKRVHELEEDLERIRELDERKDRALDISRRELCASKSIIERLQIEVKQRQANTDERMLQIDELVCKLRRDLEKEGEERANPLSASIEANEVKSSKEQLFADLQHDFELERYTLQRQHDEEIDRLSAQIAEQRSGANASVDDQSDPLSDAEVRSAQLQLQRRNGELEELLTSYSERLRGFEELQHQRDELRAELQSQWRHSEEARERELELHGRVHDLELEVKNTAELCETLQDELSKCRDAAHTSEDVQAKLEEENRKVSERVQVQDAMIHALTNEVRESKALLLQAQRENEDSRPCGETKFGDEVTASPSADVERLKAEKKMLEATLHAANRRADEEQEQLDAMRQRNISLQSEMTSLQDTLLRAQIRITDLQLEGSTTSRGIESVKRDLSDAQSANSNLKSVVSRLESHVEALTEQKERALQRKADADTKCAALQTEVLILTEKVQSATNVDMVSPAEEKAVKRIRFLERENSDRGLTIAKMQKAKQRLEDDNFNFGIALAAKQQELSMLKRRYGVKVRQITDTTQRTLHSDKGALHYMSDAQHEPTDDEKDDGTPMPALQRGPAHLKATRRKTIDGKAVELNVNSASVAARETRTSPAASKAMPPPPPPSSILSSRASRQATSRSTTSHDLRGSRRSSGTSNRTSLASSITASHGPMELSELIPVHSASNSRLRLGSFLEEMNRSTSRHDPSTTTTRLRDSREMMPA